MPVIFLDLDGVLVDFVGGVCRYFGKANPYTRPEAQGEWGLEKLLGIEPEDFWRPLSYSFWAHLEPTPDAWPILAAVENAARGPQNVCLLTSPCQTAGCVDGKMEWIKQNLPDYQRRVLFGSAKHFVAESGKILVDDSDANCDAWRKAGGQAVLVARPWNVRHNTQHDTVDYLRFCLEIATGCRSTQAAA